MANSQRQKTSGATIPTNFLCYDLFPITGLHFGALKHYRLGEPDAKTEPYTVAKMVKEVMERLNKGETVIMCYMWFSNTFIISTRIANEQS